MSLADDSCTAGGPGSGDATARQQSIPGCRAQDPAAKAPDAAVSEGARQVCLTARTRETQLHQGSVHLHGGGGNDYLLPGLTALLQNKADIFRLF